MKLLRIMLVLLLVIPTLAPLRTARAAAGDAVESGSSDEGAVISATTSTPDRGSGTNTRGGVIAAAGCGFAIASLILMPNPLSAFAVGFDCGFFLIDAGYSPDR